MELASFKVALLGISRISPEAREKVLSLSFLTKRLEESILDKAMLALELISSLRMELSSIFSEVMASLAI